MYIELIDRLVLTLKERQKQLESIDTKGQTKEIISHLDDINSITGYKYSKKIERLKSHLHEFRKLRAELGL